MHRCAKVSRAMDILCFPTDHIHPHQQLDDGCIKRDSEDFNKIKEWFKICNLFACGEKLLNLDSGK